MSLERRRTAVNAATAITLIRLLMGLLAVAFAAVATAPAIYAALALFLASSLLDVVDGAVARRLGCATAFGAFLDALVDKLVVDAFFLWMLHSSIIGLGLAVAAISRDVILQGLRGYALSAGVELKRYAVSHIAFVFYCAAVVCALLGRADVRLQRSGEAASPLFAAGLVFAFATLFAIPAASWRAMVLTSSERESIA